MKLGAFGRGREQRQQPDPIEAARAMVQRSEQTYSDLLHQASLAQTDAIQGNALLAELLAKKQEAAITQKRKEHTSVLTRASTAFSKFRIFIERNPEKKERRKQELQGVEMSREEEVEGMEDKHQQLLEAAAELRGAAAAARAAQARHIGNNDRLLQAMNQLLAA